MPQRQEGKQGEKEDDRVKAGMTPEAKSVFFLNQYDSDFSPF